MTGPSDVTEVVRKRDRARLSPKTKTSEIFETQNPCSGPPVETSPPYQQSIAADTRYAFVKDDEDEQMVSVSATPKRPAMLVAVKSAFPTSWLASVVARYRASRAAKAAMRDLMEYSDAELADIGLLRSDLAPGAFDEVADRSIQALLRVYR